MQTVENRSVILQIPPPAGPEVFRIHRQLNRQKGERTIESEVIIRKARKADARSLLGLIASLADFEKLKRPSATARKRLVRDAFGTHRRLEAVLAEAGGSPVGYAIIFEAYSSFLARPTLYLEDIFVLPEHRKRKIGLRLFQYCVREAKRRGCGRMEWVVLDWNVNAIRFYNNIGARRLKEWLPFRLERKQFSSVLRNSQRRAKC